LGGGPPLGGRNFAFGGSFVADEVVLFIVK